MFYLEEIMHTYHFENTIPVAPLKIGALESCSQLGKLVDSHIVEFRKNRLKDNHSTIAFKGYS